VAAEHVLTASKPQRESTIVVGVERQALVSQAYVGHGGQIILWPAAAPFTFSG